MWFHFDSHFYSVREWHFCAANIILLLSSADPFRGGKATDYLHTKRNSEKKLKAVGSKTELAHVYATAYFIFVSLVHYFSRSHTYRTG